MKICETNHSLQNIPKDDDLGRSRGGKGSTANAWVNTVHLLHCHQNNVLKMQI